MAITSALVQPFAICQSETVGIDLAAFFRIFCRALGDNVPRSKSAVGAVRVLNIPVSIACLGKALHSPAGKGSGARAGDSHFGRWWGAGLWVKQSDWQGDMVWHGLPASLCLLGHPFD